MLKVSNTKGPYKYSEYMDTFRVALTVDVILKVEEEGIMTRITFNSMLQLQKIGTLCKMRPNLHNKIKMINSC